MHFIQINFDLIRKLSYKIILVGCCPTTRSSWWHRRRRRYRWRRAGRPTRDTLTNHWDRTWVFLPPKRMARLDDVFPQKMMQKVNNPRKKEKCNSEREIPFTTTDPWSRAALTSTRIWRWSSLLIRSKSESQIWRIWRTMQSSGWASMSTKWWARLPRNPPECGNRDESSSSNTWLKSNPDRSPPISHSLVLVSSSASRSANVVSFTVWRLLRRDFLSCFFSVVPNLEAPICVVVYMYTFIRSTHFFIFF